MKLTRVDFKVKTILVCVSKTWGIGKISTVTKKRISLEDCSRGYWRIVGSKKAPQCECLMAVSEGEIVGVWEIDKTKGNNGWMRPAQTPKKTWPEDRGLGCPRLGCELISPSRESPVIAEMRRKFRNMRVQNIEGMDARGGVIHYNF